MFLLIDNYDSFTYNLSHYMQEIGEEVVVCRNDEIDVAEIRTLKPEGILLSPGPCTPHEAGVCLEVIKELSGKIPIFGVCLGHQSIGQCFGGQVVRAEKPMHAKISEITHQQTPLFKDIPTLFKATRYHSLIVSGDGLPDCLKVSATSSDGVIQALEHRQHPTFGVQFHPESIGSEYGHVLLGNFRDITRAFLKAKKEQR